MAADEFRSRVNHDIRTVLDGTYQIRSCKGVIHYQGDFVSVGDGREFLNIYHIGIRVSEGFHMNGSGVLLDGILYFLIVKRIYESSFDTVLREGVSQQVVGAAVNVLCGNDVLTFMSQVLKSVCDSCCTGSDSQSRYAAFESCDSFLKNILGRVGQTAVDVSCVTQTKSGCCVIAVAEYIGRSLIDWNSSCVSYRIRLLLSYMKL